MHSTLLMLIAVFCLAGFAQGLTGFGFGLVAMPLLPLLINLKDAVALTVLLNLVVCGATFLSVRLHHHARCTWRQGLGLVAGACLGVPAGVYMLVELNETLLLRILGSVMVLLAFNELLRARSGPRHISPRLGFPFGLLSGGLSGAFSMGGPPAIAFCYSQVWSKEQIVAVLQVVFGLSGLLRLILFGGAGLFHKPIFVASLWCVLPLVAAVCLGQTLFARVPQHNLRQAVFLFLGVMGIRYLLFP